MGREIRRVPPGWEHPRDDTGRYKPLHDELYKVAAEDWMLEVISWADGSHPDLQKDPELGARYFFWDWHGGPPDEEYYRPDFTEKPTHFQVYETVSEGTPTSPVFATTDEIVAWLVGEGHSRAAAEGFVKAKWCPSMVMGPRIGVVMGIDSCEITEEGT